MIVPLAEQLRPKKLADVVGQEHLTGPNGFLTRVIDKKRPLSILLWGPPGCGKTSLARLYAKAFGYRFVTLSAVFSGVADIRKVVQDIQAHPLLDRGVMLFVDEIHRFNKAQQDAFLPYVEDGTLILVGATTENPSFSLNDALLSRVRVLTLNALSFEALDQLLAQYENRYSPLPLDEDGRQQLLQYSQGDGRHLVNLIENIRALGDSNKLAASELHGILQKRPALFDRSGDQHYNSISALHKAVRGSDPDASLYWLARILQGGEDPMFVARRLIRMASEDVGLADPQALTVAVAARDSYEMLGSPEGELALAEATVYLALAPKSNAVYKAFKAAQRSAKQTGQLPPPAHILNAPTPLMKASGYGEGYRYDHDQPNAFSGQNYFPDGQNREVYYQPVERGFEREMRKRVHYFSSLRQKCTPLEKQ